MSQQGFVAKRIQNDIAESLVNLTVTTKSFKALGALTTMNFSILIRLVVLLALLSPNAYAQEGGVDFSGLYERIYQIQVVSKDAGSKSSIGSGFQVSSEGHIVTNYHVVSAFVNAPNQYNIKYATYDGQFGFLELLDFDIVSDIAVLKHPSPAAEAFELSSSIPAKGETVYALGNPGDWGIVMVPGPTNGLVEHSYEDRVLFSGSLNSGMSGGPSLSHDGKVIGVNVATAGSQLSFLVPVAKVHALLEKQRQLSQESFNVEIAAQILAWQQVRVQELIDMPWKSEEFNGKDLFGALRNDFQCWGSTNESDTERKLELVRKYCSTGDDVYIDSGINSGQISFSFRHLKPVKVNDMQFSKMQSLSMYSENDLDYEHATNFACETDFIEAEESTADSYHRVVTCIRAYKKLKGLYDSVVMVMSNSGSEVFKKQLAMSGLKKDHILQMNRRFVERSL